MGATTRPQCRGQLPCRFHKHLRLASPCAHIRRRSAAGHKDLMQDLAPAGYLVHVDIDALYLVHPADRYRNVHTAYFGITSLYIKRSGPPGRAEAVHRSAEACAVGRRFPNTPGIAARPAFGTVAQSASRPHALAIIGPCGPCLACCSKSSHPQRPLHRSAGDASSTAEPAPAQPIETTQQAGRLARTDRRAP